MLAYNDTTHSYGQKKVIRIFEHVRDTVYQLRIGEDVINTTSDHPFFVGGRWLRVKNLKAGDSVATYSGVKLAIASIRLVVGRVTVHNFEVADYHTYYVSGARVLVHNNGPCNVSHGNSKLSTRSQHVYEITDTKTGEVVKTGISGAGEDATGNSLRGLKQANNWNKGSPGQYTVKIVKRIPGGPGARKAALSAEKANAQLLRKAGHLTDPTKHVIP